MQNYYNWLQESRSSATALDADFKEEDHPRESKGGKGGGQFAKKPETLEKEDSMDTLSPEESKPLLLIGHSSDIDAHIKKLLGDAALSDVKEYPPKDIFAPIGEAIPVNEYVSDIGLEHLIEDARRTGKPIVAKDIAWWRRLCREKLAKELEKGGFSCIAYSGLCPCGGLKADGTGNCRCTKRQIDHFQTPLADLKRMFKVVEVGKPSAEK